MKSYFNLLLATLFLVSAVACSSDDSSGGGNTGGNNQTNCDNFTPRFSADVQPIINQTCAIAGCHVSGFGSGDFTTFNGIKNRAGSIKTQVVAKSMPPPNSSGPKSLTDDQIRTIRCWIDNGAENN